MKILVSCVFSLLLIFGSWAGDQKLQDVVMDANGNFVSLRQFQTQNATRSVFSIDKRDAEGKLHWQMSMEAYGPAEIKTIHTIADNHTVVVGNFCGTLFTQTWQLASSGQQDSFVAVIDSEGNATWMCQLGGISDSQIRSSQLLSEGGFVVYGTFEGMLFAENLPVYAGDTKSWFYALFDEKGSLIGLESIQGFKDETSDLRSPFSVKDLELLHKTMQPQMGPLERPLVVENPTTESIPIPHDPNPSNGG